VTGFGLAGHAARVARESRLTLEIELKALPLLPGALELADAHQAGGLKANRAAFEALVEYGGRAEAARRTLLYDPQTSGGLLIGCPGRRAGRLESAFAADGEPLWRIGRVTSGQPHIIVR
jgi:selenide,water dikinase